MTAEKNGPGSGRPGDVAVGRVLNLHRRSARRRRAACALALTVLLASAGALTRPALTMDRESFSGPEPQTSAETALTPETAEAPGVPDPSAPEPETPAETARADGDVSPGAAAAAGLPAGRGTPRDQSGRAEKLEIRPAAAVSGEDVEITVRLAGGKDDWVLAGDFAVIRWPGSGTARLECVSCPERVFYKGTDTAIATTALEPGRLTITFNGDAETVTGLIRWAELKLRLTAVVDPEHPVHSAELTVSCGPLTDTVTAEKADDYYSIYGAGGGNCRRVLDPRGNPDAAWSLCLNHDRPSPGTDDAAGGEYVRIVNPTEQQYMEFSGDPVPGNFRRVKRILYARAALYPGYNYAVFQNELYLVITGMDKYDTTWPTEDLNGQKARIRAAADDGAHDADIDDRLEVVIYEEHREKFQNTITASVRSPAPPPPDTLSVPVTKVWAGAEGPAVTVTLRADGTDADSCELSARNGWRHVFGNLPLYGASGAIISYTVSEEAVPGYVSTVTGSPECGFTVTNTEIDTSELTLGKRVTGDGGDRNRDFHFTVNLLDGGGHPLTGEYRAFRDGAPETVAVDGNGDARVALKHGESLRITGLQSGYYFHITEDEAGTDGYTTSAEGFDPAGLDGSLGGANNHLSDDGAENVSVIFTNRRDAPPGFPAEVRVRKTLDDGPPGDRRFLFILTDSDGKEVGRRENDAQGGAVFPLILPAPGVYGYSLRELDDGREGILFDAHVCSVRITVTAPPEPGDPPGITVLYDGGPGPAEFRNQHAYLLPETGGAGTGGIVGWGAALVPASLLSLRRLRSARRETDGFRKKAGTDSRRNRTRGASGRERT